MQAVVQAALPSVVLRDRVIPGAVLRLMPLDVVRKYQVSAFEMNDTTLKLAIVYPEQLKQGFMTAISDMGKRLGRKVELFKTDAASMQGVVRQYDALPPAPPTAVPAAAQPVPNAAPKPVPSSPAPVSPGSVLPQTSRPLPKHSQVKPPLFQVGKSVAFEYLKRVPFEYARQNRLVCVDFLAPDTYWFASDGTNDESLTRIIPQIESSNKIHIEPLLLKESELDDLLSYYEAQTKRPAGEVQAEQEAVKAAAAEAEAEAKAEAEAAVAAEAKKNPQDVAVPVEPEKVAEGVTTMEDQAAIVTTVHEQGGLAGLLQRVNLSLNAPKEVEKEVVPELPPVEKPKVDAPDTGVSSRSAALPVPLVQPGPNRAEEEKAAVVKPDADKPAKPEVKAAPAVKTDDESGDIGKLLEKAVETVDEFREIIKKGYIPRIVAAVVNYAIHEKASDIHIESFEDEVRVRYRVDGQLIDIVKLPPDVHAAMVSRIKILSKLRLDETRVPQDGRFDVNFNDAQVDLRVSLMPTIHGEKVVMRILDKSKGIASLEKLGIDGLAFENLTKAIQKPFGVCLATGPTGSGKSTSLYAILNRIATPNVNVVTLEDPVEYEMKGINQAQIRPKIGFTFAEGLRSILRQDPNIIMVGEIRDGETANMATQAALTGHLVLSTLHTNDAAGAVPRLTNMGIEPFLIASSVNVIMGQRLVRKICPDCKKEISLPPGFKSQIEEEMAKIQSLNELDAARIKKPLTFYQGMGCSTCGGKGYQGRMGIYEVLPVSDAVEDLTLARASNEQIREAAQKEGMITMYQDGLIKVVNGITTLDEVLRETTAG